MAELTLNVSDDLQHQIEGLLRQAALKVIEEVSSNELHKKDYFNKKEAAAYLGISYATLQKLILMGLPLITVDAKILISKDSINKFMASLEI